MPVDNDYLIGFYLEPTGYGKEYEFVCGISYLPDDEQNILQDHHFDITMAFEFPWETDDPLAANCIKNSIPNWAFSYEHYSLEEFIGLFEKNFDTLVEPFFDKTFGLKMLRENWNLFKGKSDARLILLCSRAGLDVAAVCSYLKRPIPSIIHH